ncbi:polyprenyl synthetase family protein [Marispirochaeta sp.]|jgi:geranylgeranyl diphosphate synthase, type I|uniref:polyprenyl synthetase family protein n=1 Tax=Marispirochaeta sp. TaxID=2038653 RepID=UPI0029C77215|nr:polyprenyl synthetase family protein [Marispirochaeta sp.]
MKEFFALRKKAIYNFLKDFLNRRAPELAAVNPMGTSVADRLLGYSREGKMIRGGLAALGQGLFSGNVDREADKLGSVMELFQSALLIHDDIMDRDPLRRGNPAMHVQFTEDLKNDRAFDPERTGESLGICVGDIAFFLGYEILSSIQAHYTVLGKLMTLCSREMAGVGLGQMQDIRAGVLPEPPAEDEVISLYVHKTGRYTFSLPLMAGALLGGADDRSLGILSRLGEHLGVIFQIRDDELGLFGNQQEIGKPVGTDLNEGKQTIFYVKLLNRLSEAERNQVVRLVGAPKVSPGDITFVRKKLEQTGVLEEVETLLQAYQSRILSEIDRLPSDYPDFLSILTSFAEYNFSRKV